ncbi:hypothetical protein NE237_026644 [Protea cynaroides]|uniref:Uncharacterized protein n=1 Tax=Protea cynaroides TaxID=273540 RepID=A0A9Q0H4M7_9MAGN|nr:hypothetical protein NE237_026644 [Protea cynaroides]
MIEQRIGRKLRWNSKFLRFATVGRVSHFSCFSVLYDLRRLETRHSDREKEVQPSEHVYYVHLFVPHMAYPVFLKLLFAAFVWCTAYVAVAVLGSLRLFNFRHTSSVYY